jgi:hypothetical protein
LGDFLGEARTFLSDFLGEPRTFLGVLRTDFLDELRTDFLGVLRTDFLGDPRFRLDFDFRTIGFSDLRSSSSLTVRRSRWNSDDPNSDDDILLRKNKEISSFFHFLDRLEFFLK